MASKERVPVFELHIRPLFRLLDREHMLSLVSPPIDLWDLAAVWEQRADIAARLRGVGGQNMPGERVGGPWPAEWVALFDRWVATGGDDTVGHHLVLATPDTPYKVSTMGGSRRRLSTTLTAPTDGCRAWFALDAVAAGVREYSLYLEPAFPTQPADPTPLQAIDPFNKGDATKLVVRDAVGEHEVPLA